MFCRQFCLFWMYKCFEYVKIYSFVHPSTLLKVKNYCRNLLRCGLRSYYLTETCQYRGYDFFFQCGQGRGKKWNFLCGKSNIFLTFYLKNTALCVKKNKRPLFVENFKGEKSVSMGSSLHLRYRNNPSVPVNSMHCFMYDLWLFCKFNTVRDMTYLLSDYRFLEETDERIESSLSDSLNKPRKLSNSVRVAALFKDS